MSRADYLTAHQLVGEEVDEEVIAFEVAKNQCGAKIPIEDLILHLDVPKSYFLRLCDSKLFKQKVAKYTRELTDSGTSFQLKAQIIAEDLLKTQYTLMKNPDTPASVVVTGIANIVRWAGLEKKAADSMAEMQGNKISVNISLGEPSTPATQTQTQTAKRPTITLDNGDD